jgi:hypothetical protein
MRASLFSLIAGGFVKNSVEMLDALDERFAARRMSPSPGAVMRWKGGSMLMRLLTHPRFLVIYSGVLTVIFAATVVFGVRRGLFSQQVVARSEQKNPGRVDFDQLTVHRLNIVEPDGTPRMILSDRAQYPGTFLHGKELMRPDRSDDAGLLFINDEGTEDGGLIFDGTRDKDGTVHAHGHLSFDEYDQDQAFSLETNEDGGERTSGLRLWDNGRALMTPEALHAFEEVKQMPTNTAEQREAAKAKMTAAAARYPIEITPRGFFGRDPDRASVLRLQDALGHDRILLKVAADGTPTMKFLDAWGKVMEQWPKAGVGR